MKQFTNICILFLLYSIQIKYGKQWGLMHPDLHSYLSTKDITEQLTRVIYTFLPDEYLIGILVKSSTYISAITLRTNRRYHGDLREDDAGVTPFVHLRSNGVSFFTGYVKWDGKSSYVSGLQAHHICPGKQQGISL